MDDYINNWIDRIDSALVEGVNPQRGVLEQAIHYALTVKGKRLRPILFLTLIDAYKMNALAYMDVACALEYIHTYSLIHDDLPSMDNDDFRRGMPTVHKKFDDAIALLAGDTLLTMAFERIALSPISPPGIVNILKILTSSIGLEGMAGGQALDLEFNGDRDSILTIHRMKTAELIKGALLCGAEIVGLKEAECKILREAGISIGIAFQMADDLLDVEGDEAEVGKKLHKDEGNRSPNAALFWGTDYVKREMERYFRSAMGLIEELGITFPPFLYLMEKMVFRNK
jgi:geranylgeranyl diphosphate synthase type II